MKIQMFGFSLLALFGSVAFAQSGKPADNLLVKSKYLNAANQTSDEQAHICQTDDNGQDWQALQLEYAKVATSKAFKQQRFERAKAQNKLASRLTKMTAQANISAVDGRYYIPVVFHVYGEQFNCDSGQSNCLTEAKIIDALKRTNEDFQGLTPEQEPVSPLFSGIRKNLNVEFVLAQKDPLGNPTNGIVRYDKEQTGYGEITEPFETNIKAEAWNNYQYMNVYIMNDLHDDGKTNNSGIAWYPQVSMSDEGLARVVYNGAFLGNNTDENQRSIFTHEFGHWLNLIHTFEGKTCSLAAETFCGLTGDRSCDTPQMSLPQAMQKNVENCLGQPTNTENFMHYSNNYAMFTEDQVERMTAALHGPARNTLWSNDNLVATGLSQYVSTAQHPWDGVSGIDQLPQGQLLAQYNDLSGLKGQQQTFSVTAPQNTEALAFYLDGFIQDPDMYVSYGVAPTPPQNADGQWDADHISFASPGSIEFVGVLNPDNSEPYFVTVDAFSDYDNADLHIVAADDPLLSANQKRHFVLQQKGLWASAGGKTPVYQFDIPDDAEKVVFLLGGKYQGDPDIHVSRNGPVSTEAFDCRPFSAPKLAEYCQFDQGGTFNIMIDPFKDYSDMTFEVYYVTSSGDNQPPFATVEGPFKQIAGAPLSFSSQLSTDVDGEIVSYLWDFGDGNSSAEANPIHQYDVVGDYQVSLTVTDNEGLSSTATNSADITLTYPGDADLCQDCNRYYLIQSQDMSATKGDPQLNYAFEVPQQAALVVFELAGSYQGDPDIHVGQDKPVSLESYDCRPWESPGTKETCTFTSGGTFNVMIDPFLDYSGVNFKGFYDIHKDVDPNQTTDELEAKISIIDGVVNQDIDFSANNSTGDIATYSWDFGDANSSTDASGVHQYNSVGRYDVTLSITNHAGETASQTVQVNVRLAPVNDACEADDSYSTSRRLVEGEGKCITGSNIFAVQLRGKSQVSLSLVNAPSDAKIYFKDGGWPSVSRGEFDVLSDTQGQQQCVTYDVQADSGYWGYLEITGNAEGATLMLDYDVPDCRHF